MWLQHQRGAAEGLRSLRGFTLTGELQARRRRGDALLSFVDLKPSVLGSGGCMGGEGGGRRVFSTVGGSEVEESSGGGGGRSSDALRHSNARAVLQKSEAN